jgi:hypothetical protein
MHVPLRDKIVFYNWREVQYKDTINIGHITYSVVQLVLSPDFLSLLKVKKYNLQTL